jgi:hypothetical protein
MTYLKSQAIGRAWWKTLLTCHGGQCYVYTTVTSHPLLARKHQDSMKLPQEPSRQREGRIKYGFDPFCILNCWKDLKKEPFIFKKTSSYLHHSLQSTVELCAMCHGVNTEEKKVVALNKLIYWFYKSNVECVMCQVLSYTLTEQKVQVWSGVEVETRKTLINCNQITQIKNTWWLSWGNCKIEKSVWVGDLNLRSAV